MKQRIVSFLGLWLLALLVPWLLGTAGVVLLVAVFGFFTQHEIYRMLSKCGYQAAVTPGLVVGLFVSVAAYVGPRWQVDLAAIFGGAVAVLIITFLLEPPEKRRFTSIAATLFGVALAPFMLSFLTQIVLLANVALVLWVIGVAKFADVGGLLVGMAIGRHKLAPRLSPKKTWEGVIGGICFSVIVGAASVYWLPAHFPEGLTPLFAGIIAVPLAISGICADLFESALKREAQIKDSGRVFPGIGGAFDLTDSILLAAPVAYLCLRPLLG